MPIIELTDKHRKRLDSYIAYFSEFPFGHQHICVRCNIIKDNGEYDTDLIVALNNGKLCFEKENNPFHGYPDGLTLQSWLNKIEAFYVGCCQIDAADLGAVFKSQVWGGSFNS
jgi:hypothetical protein